MSIVNHAIAHVPYLVIGYGNTLRGDDGVGYQIAETVAAWNLKDVRSIAVHQLIPELAEAISHTDTVIFVDAAADERSQVVLEAIAPTFTDSFSAHYSTPQSLLNLSHCLYGATPQGYHLLIPASDFHFGSTFSAQTDISFHIALEKLSKLFCFSHPLLREYSD